MSTRANSTSELTDSHDLHGDTEFRYTLKGNDLHAEARIDFSEQWETEFNGKLWDFINQYPEQIENFEPVTYFQHSFTDHVSVMSLIQVYKSFYSKIKRAQKLLDSGHVGNGSGALNDAEKMCQLLKVTLDENKLEFDNRTLYYSVIDTGTKLINNYQKII